MKKKSILYLLLTAIIFQFAACNSTENGSTENKKEPKTVTKIDVQGHRGCRGLMPENTIPAFLHALSLGVTTLELDVVVTADSLVIVSHEPWFSHEFSLLSGGEPVKEENEKNYNIFKMDYNKTQSFDVGTINHPRFPGQEKMNVTKPLLADVIESAINYAEKNNLPKPKFNIEIKSAPEWDSIFIPSTEIYVPLVVNTILQQLTTDNFNLQSFDFRVLQYLSKNYPTIELAVLIEDQRTPEEIIEQLGFMPQIYSCNYTLVNKELKEFCDKNNLKLIPWTVNDINAMERLIEMEVDGIITDYPNIALSLINGDLM